ncbi:TlpA family protein disulfide reductase [Antribacter gilvus]|uniref:TlpA family protein disulfide reductase n=1 Tax=Antribacter gilvus TaxID=2304675 RepID=UPI000F789D66|nr:redoxin family protein [Antribacter gilvus]
MRRPAVPLILLALLLGGCAGSPEPGAGPGPGASPSAAASSEAAEGAASSSEAPGPTPEGAGPVPEVYAFTGTTPDGATFSGEELVGNPAVLWFWAPWCPTCRSQIPTVTALAEEFDGEVAVVAVGGLDGEDAILDLAGDIPHVVHLVDDEGSVWRHFGVTQQSTYTVLDAHGEVVSEGYLSDGDISALVADLAG